MNLYFRGIRVPDAITCSIEREDDWQLREKEEKRTLLVFVSQKKERQWVAFY